MSTSGFEFEQSPDPLGRVGALLSDLEASAQQIDEKFASLSVDELKQLVESIGKSIGELEEQIRSNSKEQEHLAEQSQTLRKEIKELSLKIEEELAQLAEASGRL